MNIPSPPVIPAARVQRPLIAWSYSSITMFENCPRKWWAIKKLKIDDTNSSNYRGDQDHQSFQHYLTKGLLPPEQLRGFVPMLDKIKTSPGRLLVEHQMTLRQDFTVTHFKDWDGAWVRGAADVLLLQHNETQASYFDWKSGKFYPSDDQIELTALLAFKHFPQLERVKGLLVYYNKNKTHPHFVDRKDEALLWNGWLTRVRALEDAIRADSFPPTPNPLCKYCPYAKCQYNENPNLPR